jgi:1,4-alpha-glucan branching enzyme
MVTRTPDGTIEFKFYRPELSQVSLAGDFNGWHRAALPMEREPDGWWRYRLRLAPGVYQFKYFGDGEWYTDYAAFGLERGPLGWNSVVRVDDGARGKLALTSDRPA